MYDIDFIGTRKNVKRLGDKIGRNNGNPLGCKVTHGKNQVRHNDILAELRKANEESRRNQLSGVRS